MEDQTLVFSLQNARRIPVQCGLVPQGRGSEFGEAILRRVAVRSESQSGAASVCDALPALRDFLPDASTKRGAPGSGMSVWMQRGAPQAAFDAAECRVLRHRGRQDEEKAPERQPKARRSAGRSESATPKCSATGARWSSVGCGHVWLCADGDESDRSAAGER